MTVQTQAGNATCSVTSGSPMDAEGAWEAGAGQLSSRSNVRDMPIPEGHEFRGVQGICRSPMVSHTDADALKGRA